MTHSLTLGSLLLTDSLPDDDHGYTFSVLAEGVGFGVAQGVREVVTSLLADGDIVRTTRFGNREVSFAVQIEGPTLGALAHGEAALRREVGRGNTLTWQAPDVLSVSTVFEVVDSEMSQTFDDLDELRRKRTFVLTLTCSPFARSKDMVTVAALESGTAAVTVDACTATTGWTGSRSGAGSPALGIWTGGVGVVDLDAAVTSPETWTLTRTGLVDFTSTPYLVIEARTVSPKSQGVEAYADGANLQLLASVMLDGDGWTRFTYLASGVVSALTFTHTSAPGEAWQGLIVREVTRTDTAPAETARQVSRILSVSGTERTPASLHVVSPDGVANLDLTIVHTSPEDGSGYSPPLRRWRTVGNTVFTDVTRFSGASEPLFPNFFEAEVPVASLPRGGYLVAACMSKPTPGVAKIQRSTSTAFADGTADGFSTRIVSFDFAAANTWYFVPLGILSLPSVRATAGDVRVTIFDPFNFGISMDEAWLFRIDDDCALTVLDFTSHPNLWLDSPDLTSPVPTVWVGDDANRADARHPASGLISMGSHVLTPPATSVFVATGDTVWPQVSAAYYPRWHTNAAE